MLRGTSARRARRVAWWGSVLGFGIAMGLAGGSSAVVVSSTQATVRWTQAAGPVVAYQVFVSRNGYDFADGGLVTTNEVSVPGVPGDVVQVAVRALSIASGSFEWGPTSEPSDPIEFAAAAAALDVYPILDCPSCGRFEMRDPSGNTMMSAAYPGGGSYELVTLGEFVRGRTQALFRERSAGALWIGDISGAGMVPFASQVDPFFRSARIARPVDMDLDGAAEILLHDDVAGRFEIWGFVDNAFVLRGQWMLGQTMPLLGAGDFDGDGFPDVWFDAGHGIVLTLFFRGVTFVNYQVVGVPSEQPLTPLNITDYDGDGLADALWQDDTSRFQLSLLRGTGAAPYLVMVPLPGAANDASSAERASVNLLGDRGAEIFLQDVTSGAVDLVAPSTSGGTRSPVLQPGAAWRLVGVN